MRLAELTRRLQALKKKGFVPSRRKGPTGVGYTFEKELGLKENKISTSNLCRTEICNECGRGVRMGSGFYVNRVIDFNDKETRIEMGKPFPEGDFICIECDGRIRNNINA